ncbi:MAG: DMT family transporter [Candidatus Omnitrophota bacterium]
MKRIKFHKSDWLMLWVIQLWALNLSIVKLALKEIPSIPFNGIRLLCGSAFLVLWLFKTERNFRIKKEHGFKIILLSFSGYTLYQYFFIKGISFTTVSNTAVIFGISPIMISLFSMFFKQEKIKPIAWVGIVLAFTGVYLTISNKSGGFHLNPATLKGDLLIFLAVLLWAQYSVFARPLLKCYSPLKFTTLTMTLGSLLFVPFSFNEVAQLHFSTISVRTWLYMGYSGILGLGVGLILWFYSVKQVGNSQTAIYSNIQPLFSIFYAWVILSESIPPSLLLGAVIILLGVICTHLGRERG